MSTENSTEKDLGIKDLTKGLDHKEIIKEAIWIENYKEIKALVTTRRKVADK